MPIVMKMNKYTTTIRTTQQLLDQGYTHDSIRRGLADQQLTRIRKGIYCPTAWWSSLKPHEIYRVHIAAVHISDPTTTFSHAAAACLHGLALAKTPPAVDIVGPPDSRGRAAGTRKHYTYKPIEEHRTLVGGFRVTGLVQTVVDCSRFLPFEEATVIADSALHQGLASVEGLAHELSQVTGWGSSKCRRVMNAMSPFAESPGETLLRLILIEAGLPAPAEQVEVTLRGLRYRVDLAYTDYRIALEFDGEMKYENFGPRHKAEWAERRRESLLQNSGWTVRRYRWVDLMTRRAEIAAEIRYLLDR
ncbi:hypothetical protein [Rothia nasimurium]|uniref:hypothetical protein n=1 Tax=Rothia nasimurium TaxID=85336 RepID=UPI002DD66FC4|nr:hypothetical protein [Rothia nasimurium]